MSIAADGASSSQTFVHARVTVQGTIPWNPLTSEEMRQKYAHTRYTIRTRTRKKCTYTRGRIEHAYTKTEKRRKAAQTCDGHKALPL